MSYTISIKPPHDRHECPTCGQFVGEIDGPDPTYNLAWIFSAALQANSQIGYGLHLLDGRRVDATWDSLVKAIERLHDPGLLPVLRTLEPKNGWGDLCGAQWVMEKLQVMVSITSDDDDDWEEPRSKTGPSVGGYVPKPGAAERARGRKMNPRLAAWVWSVR